jgi:Flp pilus assembly protein TadD
MAGFSEDSSMRLMRRFALASLSIVFAGAVTGSVATASPSPPRSEPSQPATPTATAASGDETTPDNRAVAEQEYKKGYKDSKDATKLKKSGKTAEATEKFSKALKHFEEAIRLYEPYAEAWNMVGYCSRNNGDLRRAFDAYDRSLAINPDYEEAHEYVGEAYVMAGNLEKAKEQLAWLTAKKSGEAKELAESIEAAEKARAKAGSKPGAAPSPVAPASPASTDSAAVDSTAH